MGESQRLANITVLNLTAIIGQLISAMSLSIGYQLKISKTFEISTPSNPARCTYVCTVAMAIPEGAETDIVETFS